VLTGLSLCIVSVLDTRRPTTGRQEYTAADLPVLFANAGFSRVAQQVAHSAKYSVADRPIGVETHVRRHASHAAELGP
jgi:hypothetical protein